MNRSLKSYLLSTLNKISLGIKYNMEITWYFKFRLMLCVWYLFLGMCVYKHVCLYVRRRRNVPRELFAVCLLAKANLDLIAL